MKTNNSNGNDDSLRALLREWKPEVSLPPHFQDQVWRRIERAEAAPAPSITLAAALANWITNRLPKPALATAYVTLLLVLGAGAGWSQGQHKTARITSELSARYAQSVDPYQPARQP